MTATYFPGSSESRNLVRLLISDTDMDNALFQDAEIDALINLEDGNVRRAAANALDTIASSESLILKRITLLDLSTDGPAVAKDLRAHAKELRRQDAEGADAFEDLFDWAEMVDDPFAFRERVYKEALRD